MSNDKTALVPAGQSRSAGLAAFVGELKDRVMAFDQIATAIATSQAFPGYDNVQKVKAACWAADALAVHPVAYMSGVYAADMRGKLVMIPKVTFEDGLLRSRLPGYDYEVLKESATECEIRFYAEGRKPQIGRYTWEQAIKAGLATKDTYKNYPDKMLFARAFHMGAHRIGPHILAGLPDPTDYDAVAPADLERPSREPSAAVVLDDAAAVEVGDGSGGAAPPSAPATPPSSAPIVDWYVTLSATLKLVFGPLKKDQLIAKASTVWAAIAKEQGLPVPTPFTKAKDFGPVEAQQMTEWLRAKYPQETNTNRAEEPPDEPPVEEERAARDVAPEAEVVEGSQEPPANEDEAPALIDAAAEEAEALAAAQDEKVETLFLLASAAKKSHAGRVFVQESPVGTGTWWFVDKEISAARGYTSGQMLQKAGEQRMSPSECALLVKMMREAGVAIADRT